MRGVGAVRQEVLLPSGLCRNYIISSRSREGQPPAKSHTRSDHAVNAARQADETSHFLTHGTRDADTRSAESAGAEPWTDGEAKFYDALSLRQADTGTQAARSGV